MNKKEKAILIDLKNQLTANYIEAEKTIKVLHRICKRHGLRMSIECKYNLYVILSSDKTNEEEKQDANIIYANYQQAIGKINTINQIIKLLGVE